MHPSCRKIFGVKTQQQGDDGLDSLKSLATQVFYSLAQRYDSHRAPDPGSRKDGRHADIAGILDLISQASKWNSTNLGM